MVKNLPANAGDTGSSPGPGTKIPPTAWRGQNKQTKKTTQKKHREGFPGGAVVENLPADAGNTGSSPGLGRSQMPRSN